MGSRYELIHLTFRHMEPPESHRLSYESMFNYAQKTGFLGGPLDFEAEHENLSRKYGWIKENGPTLADFAFMVNDENGSFSCSTDDLREIVQELVDSVKKDLPMLSFTRELMQLKLFIALQPRDTDHLNINSMRMFSSFKGFKGSAAEWLKEFLAMCHDYGWDDRVGVDLQGFIGLLNNEKSGGYCT